MTIRELQQRYCGGLKPHEEQLLRRHQEELQTAGLVDEAGTPTGAGTHVIPLFLFVHMVNREMVRLASTAAMDECEESESDPSFNTHLVMKDFGNLLTDATRQVEKDGHENARDLVTSTVIPHMNSFFALGFVWLLTQLRFIDIIGKDPSVESAFDSEAFNDTSFRAIAIYRNLAAEHGDQWAVMIADKAKMFWGGSC